MADDLTKFTVHMIGNAHIDPAWLWQWKEGRDEVFNTYRSALNLLKEFPQLTFTCSAAVTYEWVEQAARAMFDEIRERVAEGRWEIVNGWWVQPDCNVPSGESFIRHSLYGKGYFLEKFGVDVKTGYNVDSFGHCGTLPMILRKAGFDHYVFFRPGPNEKQLPGNLFWWESDDGSRVLALRAPHHYGTWGEIDFAQRITDACRMWTVPVTHVACFYGIGNHGGGPTRDDIRRIMNVQQMPNMPRVEFSTLGRFFREALAQTRDFPVVHDDLQHHAVGCYTAVSEIKRQNRECEALLLASERLATCASMLGGPPRQTTFARGWKKVLFNQFHDILAGTSIRPVYDDTADDCAIVTRDAAAALAESIARITQEMDTQAAVLPPQQNRWMPINPLVLVNTLPWDRADAATADVILPDFSSQISVQDAEGAALPVQVIGRTDQAGRCRVRVCFIARMPALSCSVLRVLVGEPAGAPGAMNEAGAHGGVPRDGNRGRTPSAPAIAGYESTIEGPRYKLAADPENGWVVSLFDKLTGVECLAGPACVPVVIDDPSDTWSHDVVEFRTEIGRFRGPAAVVECGPVRAVIRARQCYGHSTIEQDYIIYNGLDRVDCEMRIDWHERHKMLKLAVPVNVADPKAVFEAPLGTIQRQPLGHEEPGQRWIDVEGTAPNGDTRGLLLINDSKYGYDVKDNEVRVSILRSPIYAFHNPRKVEWGKQYLYTDQGRQTVRYSLMPHAGDWRDADAARQGYALNNPPIVSEAAVHPGRLGRCTSLVRTSPDNVVCEVVKQAEDGKGVIVRVYEAAGRDTAASVHLAAIGVTHAFAIGHNEVKTFRIVNGTVAETSLLER